MNDPNNRLELRLSSDNCTPGLTRFIDGLVNDRRPHGRMPFIPPVANPESQPAPDKILVPIHLREYKPKAKIYYDDDLEKVLKSGFNARDYARQIVYKKVDELDSKRARITDPVARIENLHETLDVVHEGCSVFNQLLGYAQRASLVYGVFKPDLARTLEGLERRKNFYHRKRAEAFKHVEEINREARRASRQRQRR